MNDKNPASIIRQSFVVSFILLLCIILTYQSIIFVQAWTGNSDANKVNIAGRQRMLSQRIGKNLLYSLSAKEIDRRNHFIGLAADDLNTLETNHLKLEQSSSKSLLIANNDNNSINKALLKIKKPLSLMTASVKAAEKLKNNAALNTQGNLEINTRLYFDNEQDFLRQMDNIVKLYELDLERYVTQLNGLSWFGAATILLVMFVNGKFIVYKAIRAVEFQFTDLQKTKEFQTTILNCSREGIVSINRQGCITLMNARAERLFACTEDKFLGKRVTALLPCFDLARHPQLINDGKMYKTDQEAKMTNGKLFPVVINISRLDSRNRHEMVLFIKDMTETREKERELLSIKQEVAEAVDANNAKSQFLSNMSHELRTPLNSIIGFSQLLATDDEPKLAPQHVEYAGYIHNAGSHLLSLINEILDLARLESGKVSLSLETVNLSELVKEVMILVYNLAIKKQIKIFSQIESLPDYYVTADKVRLKQVLLNLVSNAIKYNHENGRIELALEEAGKNIVKLHVIDNGYGIAEKKIKSLFEPFNRLGAENSKIEGAGIGLTITKDLIEEMDGNIGVMSEEGKGSDFWVELPLAKEKPVSDDTDEKSVTLPGSVLYNKVPECEIIYIEDNYSNTALVKSFVNRIEGMTLYDAEDAKVGLKMINKIKPDLVLMDLDLPDINGFEALKTIREQETMHTPVIAISANVMDKDIEKGMAAGFDAYLTKPIEIDSFYKAINDSLFQMKA